MSIMKKIAPWAWTRISRINPLFEAKIGERNLRVPSNAMKWGACWRTDIIKHFLKVNSGDFIDIGANVGQTLYDFYSLNDGRKYIGFEPNSNCVAIIEDVIRRNRLEHYSIAPVGLSDSNTILPLYFNTPKDSGATLIVDLRPADNFVSKLVPVFRFDDIRETLAISEIAIIKIDVEGSERQVLAGMQETLSRFKPPIVCEVLRMDADADRENYKNTVFNLMEMLTQLNYLVFRIEKNDDDPSLRLAGLTRVTEFPLDVWAPETAEANDYLFIPAEKRNLLPSAA